MPCQLAEGQDLGKVKQLLPKSLGQAELLRAAELCWELGWAQRCHKPQSFVTRGGRL